MPIQAEVVMIIDTETDGQVVLKAWPFSEDVEIGVRRPDVAMKLGSGSTGWDDYTEAALYTYLSPVMIRDLIDYLAPHAAVPVWTVGELGLCGPIDSATECCRAPVVEVEPESVLAEAQRIVGGQRRGAYGTPERNFERIQLLWNAYLNGKPGGPMPITEQDTALMMVMLKVARLIESPRHRDSVVDIAGYAACIETLWEHDEQ